MRVRLHEFPAGAALGRPMAAGLWESAYSTVSATVSGCMWRRLAGVIRWVSP